MSAMLLPPSLKASLEKKGKQFLTALIPASKHSHTGAGDQDRLATRRQFYSIMGKHIIPGRCRSSGLAWKDTLPSLLRASRPEMLIARSLIRAR